MEELRSTDILDKEIQGEARKKAQGIVDASVAESKRILEGVDARVEKSKSEKQKIYDAKEQKYRKDAEASLPLEKERFLVQFVGSSIDEAIQDYLKNLGAEKRLDLAAGIIDRIKSVTDGKKFSATVFGFDENSAKAAVEKKLGSKLLSCKSGRDADIQEGIVIESEDKSIRARLTINEVVEEAKDKYYKEMSDALFGGRL